MLFMADPAALRHGIRRFREEGGAPRPTHPATFELHSQKNQGPSGSRVGGVEGLGGEGGERGRTRQRPKFPRPQNFPLMPSNVPPGQGPKQTLEGGGRERSSGWEGIKNKQKRAWGPWSCVRRGRPEGSWNCKGNSRQPAWAPPPRCAGLRGRPHGAFWVALWGAHGPPLQPRAACPAFSLCAATCGPQPAPNLALIHLVQTRCGAHPGLGEDQPEGESGLGVAQG